VCICSVCGTEEGGNGGREGGRRIWQKRGRGVDSDREKEAETERERER
jgi:hypothetical protein